MKPRDIPNLITFCRILLVGPCAFMMLSERFDVALGLFVLAGISDALDGFLAKYFHWQSRLGSYLDPIADKLLLVSCYLALGHLQLLPLWLVLVVVLRDVIIFGGALAYYFLLRPFEGEPLLLSKLNTLFQLGLVALILFDRGVARMPEILISGSILLVTLTTIGSGLLYVRIWGSRYHRGG